MNMPVVFLLGPSGVGKTTLGDALASELGMLHILFDGHPQGDGVNVNGLRSEWDKLLETRNPLPLADEVRRRIETSGHSGAVISCSSGIMPAEDDRAAQWHFPRSLLGAMSAIGVRAAQLVGPLETCKEAAIRRTTPKVTAASWEESNKWWRGFQKSAFPENVLEMFDGEHRRPIAELVEEFRQRFLW